METPGGGQGQKATSGTRFGPIFEPLALSAPGPHDAVRRRHSAGTTHPASGHEISGRRR